MPNAAALAALDQEIADVRENIRDLTEQAAAYSGAEDEALTSDRLAEARGFACTAFKRPRGRGELEQRMPTLTLGLAGHFEPTQTGLLLRFCCNGALECLDIQICLWLPATRTIVVAYVRRSDVLIDRPNSGTLARPSTAIGFKPVVCTTWQKAQ